MEQGLKARGPFIVDWIIFGNLWLRKRQVVVDNWFVCVCLWCVCAFVVRLWSLCVWTWFRICCSALAGVCGLRGLRILGDAI